MILFNKLYVYVVIHEINRLFTLDLCFIEFYLFCVGRYFPGSLPPSPTCNNSNIPLTSNKPIQTISSTSTHPPQISKHATTNPQTGNSNPPPNSSSDSHSTPKQDAATKNNPGL